MGSVAEPVIQDNGRLTFEELEVRRSTMLLYTVKQHPHWACRQYGHSGMADCQEMSTLPAG